MRFICNSLALFVILSAISFPIKARKVKNIDNNSSYILVDIEDLQGGSRDGKFPGSMTIARYDPEKRDVRGGERSPQTALPNNVSPRITFSSNPISKQKGRRQYLVELPPDVWVIEGSNGTAFSLGSYTFEVGAGQIVDLGVFSPSVDTLAGDKTPSIVGTVLSASLFGIFGGMPEPRPTKLKHRARSEADMAIPAILVGRQIVQPKLKPGARFGNYLGGLINRFGGRETREFDQVPAPAQVEESLSGN